MKTATKTKEKVTFSKWDPAEVIETKEDIIALLEVALEESDPDLLLSVIGDIARSKGMAQIARELNLDRKGLYKSLSPDGNPSFKTVFKLLDLMGLRLKMELKSAQGQALISSPKNYPNWAFRDLNPGPTDYESAALTN